MQAPIFIAGAGLLLAAAAVAGRAGPGSAPGAAAAQGARPGFERPLVRSRGINVHHYGIRAAVETPASRPGGRRRVVVRDLGPSVAGLADDRAPGGARLFIDQDPPRALLPDGRGDWYLEIDPAWLGGLTPHEVRVEVLDGQGSALFSTHLDGRFF